MDAFYATTTWAGRLIHVTILQIHMYVFRGVFANSKLLFSTREFIS